VSRSVPALPENRPTNHTGPGKVHSSAMKKPPQKKPAAGRPDRPRHRAKTEEMFHGLRACLALFATRPQDIVRVYVDRGRQKECAKLLAWCARERKGFQVVEDENLRRITGSVHHEGVAILAAQVCRLDLAGLLARLAEGPPLLYLDGVQNPHNLGSILRTAAHFGAGAIVGKAGDVPPLSPAAVRVAEGAAEHVPVCDLADPTRDLARLKKEGYQLVATSSHRGEPLFAASLGRRVMLVLGSEGQGVSRPIEALADLRVRIPGTGAVESLNVAVACGVVLAETWRRHPPR
jgi:TrmH RNA methyltransferase